ncbi:unnamed protein product [Urochloa decumbens]|uniref:Uncharacterized protein n=1 Tax=Urochloa decumbens TaxID=240449 RepID=A0ABC8XY91_9POAL
MAMATLLKKFVNPDEWEAEDHVGRLGLIAHAAFLHAGFLPYGAKPRSGQLLKQAGNTDTGTGSSVVLSRRYTVPELARREGSDAAVLMLCKGDGGDFALLIYLTTDRDMRRAYRHADLVMAACASRQLRRLVAEHDVELWKPLYEAAVGDRRFCRGCGIVGFLERISVKLTWKRRCALQQVFSRPFPHLPPTTPIKSNARGKRGDGHRPRNVPRYYDDDYDWKQHDKSEAIDSPERIDRGKAGAEGRRHKVPRHRWNRKRRHGAGTINSPSSRYRWNQR